MVGLALAAALTIAVLMALHGDGQFGRVSLLLTKASSSRTESASESATLLAAASDTESTTTSIGARVAQTAVLDTHGAPTEIVFVCVDAHGGAVGGARIEVRSHSNELLELTTNAEGCATFSRAEFVGPWTVTGRHPVLATPRRCFPIDIGSRVVLRWQDALSIRGVVVHRSGASPGAGLRVIAHRLGALEDLLSVAIEPAARSGETAITETSHDGSFVLTGLAAGSYTLLTGGRGLLQEALVHGVEAGAGDVRLSVSPGYACALYVREKGGSIVDPGASRGSGECRLDPSAHARRAVEARASAILAGLPPEFVRERNILLYLYADDGAPASIGPLRVQWQFDGYEAYQSTFEAQSLGVGGTRATIELIPRAGLFGQCRVRFHNAPVDIAATLRTSRSSACRERILCGSVVLEADDGERLEYYLYHEAANAWLATHIPAGLYRARVRSRDGLFEFPPRAAAALSIVVAATTPEIDIDLAATGALEIRLLYADQSVHAGQAILSLGHDEAAGKIADAFEHGPYLYPFVDAGIVHGRVIFPGLFVTADGRRSYTTTVSAGARSIVELREP